MKPRKEHITIDGMECKYCSKCKLFVSINFFSRNKSTWDGLHCRCKSCKKIDSKLEYQLNSEEYKIRATNWALENKEKYTEYQNNYKIENSEQIKEKYQSWINDNKDYINEYNKIYKQNRRKDINYRLLENLRSRLYRAVTNSKSKSTLELIGCDIKTLKTYLTEKFQPGMNWENYGQWHIDHIIPCSFFNLLDKNHQEECFHYTNLQPLWAADNLKKSDKIIF